MPDATVTILPRTKRGTGVTRRTARPRTPRKTQAQLLADDVRDAYNRWVVFHSDYKEAQAGTMTLYTFHTWFYDLAYFTPYILISAPTSEAGKSRTFDVAKFLVRKPFVVADPTPAGLFAAIEAWQPTLLIDEVDTLRESKQLRAVLNLGFQKDAPPIIRMKKLYYCYGPKMFSGIAGEDPPVTGATLSRCIQIVIRRKSRNEKSERFIPHLAAKTLVPIHARLEVWAQKNRDKFVDAYPDNIPSELSDRQADIWASLFIVADILGGQWPKNARKWAVELSQSIPKPADKAVQILGDVKKVLDDFPDDRISSRQLADLRNALPMRDFDASLSPDALGKRLSGFGIQSIRYRDGGRGSIQQRGYQIRSRGKLAATWADAFERYGV